MSKMIVVIDKPDSCIECPCSDFDKQNVCRILVRPIDDETHGLDGKPDWCPLKELPNKKTQDNPNGRNMYRAGWNDCIDTLIKE